ncbi:hypothetical protein [Vibrio phage JSF12]|uniref:Uncharacterized protein n=2 Tax=Jesfedecavirus TaxID=2560156 RepID=A0A2D0Z366_9CAUD|nr:hypothetical protein FDI98_gp015 [Vibrio phage JSF10]YP_009794746.1 hypothetical protein HOS35_gp063 [Vibrio phage JSF12]ASV43517.1 hypothetical protein [Vibrio phage JSF10]ASV43581.1 hypothetical protein [Vibrio phage JSF12]
MALLATYCRAYSQGYRDGVQCERELSYKCKDEAELED